jgi:hypothetical protein
LQDSAASHTANHTHSSKRAIFGLVTQISRTVISRVKYVGSFGLKMVDAVFDLFTEKLLITNQFPSLCDVS